MRLLTVLALVVALTAAVAARTAGSKSGPGTISIKKITYQTNDVNLETVVCLNDEAGDLPDKKLVTVGIKLREEVTDYPAESVAGKCATILASPPDNNDEVKYSLAFKSDATDESVQPENEATRGFTFIELAQENQIKCDQRTFTITSIAADAEVPVGCLKGAVKGGNCYTEVTRKARTEPDPGCKAPTGDADEFQYCQTGGDVFEGNGVSKVAKSLQYGDGPSGTGTGVLTLADTGVPTVEDVIVVRDDGAAQAPKLQTSFSSVTLVDFQRSAATYTACPVTAGFTAYELTDLYVLGSYEGSSYYEFGFRYAESSPEKYVASTTVDNGGTAEGSTVTVNCAPLTAGDSTRCYGYLPADGSTALSLSYADDETTNVIIVEKAQLDPRA